MSDLNEKLAQEAAELINGGEWSNGKWYSDGHREAWRRAMKPAADRIEQLEGDIVKYSGTVVNLRDDNESLNRNLDRAIAILTDQKKRIEQLEAALREIAKSQPADSEQAFSFKMIARAALEGKKDGPQKLI